MVLPDFQLYNYCVFFPPFQLISNLWGDTLIQCKHPAPLQNVPTALAFIEASCLIRLLTVMLAKCWFSRSPTPSIFIGQPLAFYCKQESYLFTYQLVIGMDLLISGVFFFSSGLQCITVPNDWASASPLNLAFVLFWPAPVIFCHSFHCGTTWYFRCILYLPHIHLLINHFSREPWFLVAQDLGVRCVPCYWGNFVSWSFQWTKVGSVWMHIHIHMDVNAYIRMCSYKRACTRFRNQSSCHSSNFHLSPLGSFLPSLLSNSYVLCPWEPWLPTTEAHLLICSILKFP